MIITYLRASSYNTHESCPQQYFGEYVLGWKGPSNKRADMGTIFHKVMEILALCKKAEQKHKTKIKFDIPVVFNLKDKPGEFNFKSQRDILREPGTVDIILKHIYEYYTNRFNHNIWNNADLIECSKWIEKICNTRYYPLNLEIKDTEVHFDFEITQPWAMYDYEINGEKLEGFLGLKGTIDLILNVEDGIVEILDWKTGASRKHWITSKVKELKDFYKDPQLRIYHYAVHKIYPEIHQAIVTINYINAGGPFTVCFTDEDLPETEEMIKRKFEHIKNTQIPNLNKSWKCTKTCFFGQSTFENTHVLPIIEKRPYQVTPIGEPMTKCEQIKCVLQHRDMNTVIKNMSSPNHHFDKYQSPGGHE